MCAQMSMHAIAHWGCTDIVRVCAGGWLWEKSPLPHRGLEPVTYSVVSVFSVGCLTNWAVRSPRSLAATDCFHFPRKPRSISQNCNRTHVLLRRRWYKLSSYKLMWYLTGSGMAKLTKVAHFSTSKHWTKCLKNQRPWICEFKVAHFSTNKHWMKCSRNKHPWICEFKVALFSLNIRLITSLNPLMNSKIGLHNVYSLKYVVFLPLPPPPQPVFNNFFCQLVVHNRSYVLNEWIWRVSCA